MIKRLLLLLALAVTPAFATTVQITGVLTDAAGSPLAFGTACFKLPVNAQDISTSKALSTAPVCFAISNGTFPASANLVPNDVIQPAGTYYSVTVKSPAGQVVYVANYVINSVPSTFNIGQATPTSVLTTNISYLNPVTAGGNNIFTGNDTFANVNGVQWAGPGATPTCDTAVTNLGSNPGTVMISSLYTGPECAALTFNAVDGSAYNIYRGSNNITIHDLRASTNKAYGINYGGTTLGSLARFAVTQNITSPTTTTSAGLFTNQFTGTLVAAGAMASLTAELDSEGAISGVAPNIVQAINGQIGIRSTGLTLPFVAGIEGGGGIDRAAASTNVGTMSSISGDTLTNIGTGTIQDAFGGRFANQTVGTRNNMAAALLGNFMVADNGCLYSENGSSPALKNVCFGRDNAGTGGVNIYGSTVGFGPVLKFIDQAGTHFNFMLASQQNISNAFEITPSTTVGGTTFTTPQFQVLPPASGNPAVIVQNNVSGGTGLRVTPGSDASNVLTVTNAANSVNQFEFDGQAHLQTNEAATTPGVSASGKYLTWNDPTVHTPSWSNNANAISSPTGAWQCTNVTPVTVTANTTATQNLMSCVVPAGTLNRVGRTLRVWLAGIYSTPAASTTAIVITVKLGPLLLGNWTSTALGGIQATNDQWNLTAYTTTTTAGTLGFFEPHGNMVIDLGIGNTVADSTFADQNTVAQGTVDFTAAQTLQVLVTTTVGQGAGFSFSQRQMILETIN